MRFRFRLAFTVALAPCLSAQDAHSSPKPSPALGKPAPEFSLKNDSGGGVKLSSFLGKRNVLVAFCAQEPSRDCTAALKSLRDDQETLLKAQVEVLAISPDSRESQKKLAGELKLPFPLLSDADGKIAKLYGVEAGSSRGEIPGGRAMFLVDKTGILRHVDTNYDLKSPEDHDALLRAVRALGGGAKNRAPTAFPKISAIEFGKITVDGKEHTNDVVFDRGKVRERDKAPSRGLKAQLGHTPLSAMEDIPWDCKTLLIGIGMDGQLPILDEVKEEARKRGVKLILKKTAEAVEYLRDHYEEGLNVILHITC